MTIRRARRIPDLAPGTPEWLRLMTASKVSAVLGLSPHESRFSLWHRMAGHLDATPDTDRTRRGHYLEAGTAAWLADQYPHLRFGRTGSWVSKDRPWQSATPDRLVRDGRRTVGVAEIKTDAGSPDWGRDGSDDIPPHYRVQVVWQMDCLGLPTAYIAALLPRLEFRGYVVQFDQAEAEFIRSEVRSFLDSLPGGPAEQMPDIDGHDETYVALRQLHPDIEDGSVVVPAAEAAAFCGAHSQLKAAERDWALARNDMAQLLGNAHTADVQLTPESVRTIARRQAKGGGTPYVVAATPLPDLTHLTQETAA